MKKILPFIAFLFAAFAVFAQAEDDDGYVTAGEDDGITVTGTRETSQQMRVVEKAEIEKRGAGDLASLLQETLDIGITRYGGYGNNNEINLRGFDSERVAFLIDGVPANDALGGEFDISQIDLHSVERIEVIYGGSDTKYNVSGALGGVINIITTKETQKGVRISGSVSNTGYLPGKNRGFDGRQKDAHYEDLIDTQNITAGVSFGADNFSFAVNGFFNRAGNHFLFKDDITRSIKRKVYNEVYDGGAGAAFNARLANVTRIIADAKIYYGDKNIPTSGNSSIYGIQRDFSGRENIMFDMPIVAGSEKISAEGSITHSWRNSEYELTGVSKNNIHSLAAINRWAFYVHKTLTLRAGGDWRFAALDSDSLGGRARNEGGIYGTAEWQPAAFFMLIPSVKAAFCSDGSVPATAVPKLGLVFNVNENLTFKNNYFRSFKFPDFEDLYYGESGSYAGNPDLKPEDGWGADAGAAWRVKSLSLEASAFWQWTADSIHWSVGADSIWRPYNVGEAAFAGTDARISFDLPHPRFLTGLRPAFSYQFMRSWLLSYGYSWKSDKRIPYQAEHTAGASLEARWRGGRTGLSAGSLLVSAHFESRRFADTANLSKLPAYLLVNITLNQHISKNMAVFAAVRNITNTHYQSFKDYPMPGFNFTLGLRVKTEAQSLSNTNKEALYG